MLYFNESVMFQLDLCRQHGRKSEWLECMQYIKAARDITNYPNSGSRVVGHVLRMQVSVKLDCQMDAH